MYLIRFDAVGYSFLLFVKASRLIILQRGYELPWRVIIWRTTRDSTVLKRTSSTLQGSGGRKRAGKKKRIATRKKLALLQSQRTQAALNQQEKDVADREKRTRRNREKKVKKKERDKSMKVAKSLDDK